MRISLDNSLRTGILGDLRPGLSKEDVKQLLGPPDAEGGTSRKYPQPCIFLYGTTEIYFQQQRPRELTGIFWQAEERGAFRLTPACTITDWAFTPETTWEDAEDYLNNRDIPFEYGPPGGDVICDTIILASDVRLGFWRSRLHAISWYGGGGP